MELNKRISMSICLILMLIMTGCGLTGNLLDWEGQDSLEAYVAEGQEKLPEMRKYISKSHEDLERTFGKPTDILSPAWFMDVKYEEEWYYKYDKGIPLLFPNEHTMSFYFNEGKVAAVKAL
jgi:hypothetical protein